MADKDWDQGTRLKLALCVPYQVPTDLIPVDQVKQAPVYPVHQQQKQTILLLGSPTCKFGDLGSWP